MKIIVGIIVILVVLAIFSVSIRHSKIEHYNILIESLENNDFTNGHIVHYIESKIIEYEYKIEKLKLHEDHPFLKKVVIEEYLWYKSILDEENVSLIVYEKKNKLKSIIINEMLNHPIVNHL